MAAQGDGVGAAAPIGVESAGGLHLTLSDSPPEGVFEIGLVLAGAVSAGCYIAGVLDFLFEALDAYDEARRAPDWDGPDHEVRVRIVTGTSGGGICAVLFAAALNRRFAHVRTPGQAASNPMFRLWVDDIDIVDLLETSDLDGGQPLRSALDATKLETAALDTVAAFRDIPAVQERRAWIDDPLPVFITATNLRGMPYAFAFQNPESTRLYGMTSHADALKFSASGSGKPIQNHVTLDAGRPDGAVAGGWSDAIAAALATSAFPVGLAARVVKRNVAEYRNDDGFPHPSPSFADEVWAADPPDYAFAAVDGGVIDNEPIEIARRFLAKEDKLNARDGNVSRRCVILVDPFPNELMANPAAFLDRGLKAIVPRLLGALVQQARFKPEELALATDETSYSRFAILPSRSVDGMKRAPALACGQLGGFSGFFARAYREHDYLLGRANCQSFLRNYFVLTDENPLFHRARRSASPLDHARWRVRTADGQEVARPSAPGAAPQPVLPIVPLVARLQAPLPQPAPPPDGAGAIDMATLETAVRRRTAAVLKAVGREFGVSAAITKAAIWWYGDRIHGAIMRWMRNGLDDWKA